MFLFSTLDAGQLYQAAFKSPEQLLTYLQSSILHDTLARCTLDYLSGYCSSNEEQHSYALFSSDASVLSSRVRFVQNHCSLLSGGISVGLRGGRGFSFSISDSLFDIDALPLDDPEGTNRHALSWLLLLQLPIVKMYNSAVYERLLTRLYWRLANDDTLLSAALSSHQAKSVTFVKSDFKHYNDLAESDNPSSLYLFYPGLSAFCCRKNSSDARVSWDGNKLAFKLNDAGALNTFKLLARQQLYSIVPSSRNFNSPKTAITLANLDLDFDAASYTILDGVDPDAYRSLQAILATHAPRQDAITGNITYDTSGVDFAYLNDTPEDAISQQRYVVISKVIDHALLSQLRRNDCFQRHIKYSLAGIFGLNTLATKDLSVAFSEHLRGWETRAKYYPFYCSLDPDSAGTLDPSSVSWCLPSNSISDPYLANMDRWLTTFSVEALVKTPIEDLVRATPSALNLSVPSIPFLSHQVWSVDSLGETQVRLAASMLSAPSSRRDEKPYFASYVANLALAVSEYFHSVYSFKTLNGDDPVNVSAFSAASSLSVPLLRLLCDVGLHAIPVQLNKEGRLHSYVPTEKDIILLHTPRLLRYLSQDGYLGVLASGLSSVLNTDSVSHYKTSAYIFGWDIDSLPTYRNRLSRLHTHVMPTVFGGQDNVNGVSNAVNSEIIRPLNSYDKDNYLWSTAEPAFKPTERFLVLHTPKLYRHLRQNCASNIGPKLTTLSSYKINTGKNKDIANSKRRKKHSSRRNHYDVHELSHFLPLGRELKVKLVRKGFDVFVSLPWEDLRDWYGLFPPVVSAAYRSSRLSKKTLTTKINSFANCKKNGWGLYHEYRERLKGIRSGSPSTIFDEWTDSYDGEQLRLNTSTVRLFKGLGFVFALKALMSGSSNWDFNGKPVDSVPGWDELVSYWYNYSFPLNEHVQTAVAKKDIQAHIKAQRLAEYEANLKLPKRQRKDLRIRFTEEEDAAILKYYRRDMSLEDEKVLREICHRHDAFGVSCRANKLAEKLIKEHGITDVTQLPIKRLGKKLSVILKSARKP